METKAFSGSGFGRTDIEIQRAGGRCNEWRAANQGGRIKKDDAQMKKIEIGVGVWMTTGERDGGTGTR